MRTEDGQLLEDIRARLKRLEKFSNVSKEIMGNLGTTKLNDRLTLIARYAADLLNAETCGVLLVKREGFLSLEAGFGHRIETFQMGREFAICTGIKTGLTGHIAFEGHLFNSYDDELINHPAVAGEIANHTESGKCFSLLAIPLMKRDKEGERLIGLLRVDNKKGKDGIPTSSERFSVEDEWLLSIFAETVVVALESAELVGQLNEKQEDLERMVDNVREAEGRLQLLLKANNIVVGAEDLDKSLQSLARMLVSLLKHTFCRIYLFEEGENCVVVRAACPIDRSSSKLSWHHELQQQIILAECPAMDSIMRAKSPAVLRNGDATAKEILIAHRSRLGLEQDIQSLLLIPLRVGDRALGMIEMGELRKGERGLFTHEQIELLSTIAAQIVYFIDRMVQHEISERRRMLLSKLNKALFPVREDREWPKLIQEVVRQAAYLVDCTTSCLYLSYPGKEELELIAVHGLPPQSVGTRIRHGEGLAGLAAISGQGYVERNYSAKTTHESMLFSHIIKTAAVTPLKQTGQVKMVLFVGDTKEGRLWSEMDDEVLHMYAERAFVALEACRLMKQDASALQHLVLLSRIMEYAQIAGHLDKILHAILTGVTAGYGLGLNRAALFLLDEHKTCFVGKAGIGHLDKDWAERDWDDHKKRGLEDLTKYFLLLDSGEISETPLGKAICGLRVDVEDADDLLRIIHDGGVKRIPSEEIDRFPRNLTNVFQPSLPLVLAPVRAKGQNLGFLLADNKFTGSPITDGNLEALADFAKVAANAIVGEDRETFWRNLLFDAAHTIIIPISIMELYFDPIAQRIESNPQEALELLQKIELSVEQLKRIIAQVKSLTRGQEPAKHPTDIIPLVRAACDMAELRGIKLTINVSSEPVNVLADPTRLSECFGEMIMNSLRWLSGPVKLMKVQITTFPLEKLYDGSVPEKGYSCIHFRDNGPGVPRELKERIFDPFFSTFPGGDGIGLSHARRIILGYGGLIREVGVPGQGADFEIYLPLA